jgi:hypothetical protein
MNNASSSPFCCGEKRQRAPDQNSDEGQRSAKRQRTAHDGRPVVMAQEDQSSALIPGMPQWPRDKLLQPWSGSVCNLVLVSRQAPQAMRPLLEGLDPRSVSNLARTSRTIGAVVREQQRMATAAKFLQYQQQGRSPLKPPASQFAEAAANNVMYPRLELNDCIDMDGLCDGLAAAGGWRTLSLEVRFSQIGRLPMAMAKLADRLKRIAPIASIAPTVQRQLQLTLREDLHRSPSGDADLAALVAALESTLAPASSLQVTQLSILGRHCPRMSCGLLPFIARSATLESLRFSCGFESWDAQLLFNRLMEAICSGCQGLRELEVNAIGGVTDFSRLRHLLLVRSGIRSLSLSCERFDDRRPKGLVIADLLGGNLVELELRDLHLGRRNLDRLEKVLPANRHLQNLKIWNCFFEEGIRPLLVGLVLNMSLRHLEFVANKVDDRRYEPDRLLRILHQHPALQHLEIDDFRDPAFRAQLLSLELAGEVQICVHDVRQFSAQSDVARASWAAGTDEVRQNPRRSSASGAAIDDDASSVETTVEMTSDDDDREVPASAANAADIALSAGKPMPDASLTSVTFVFARSYVNNSGFLVTATPTM